MRKRGPQADRLKNGVRGGLLSRAWLVGIISAHVGVLPIFLRFAAGDSYGCWGWKHYYCFGFAHRGLRGIDVCQSGFEVDGWGEAEFCAEFSPPAAGVARGGRAEYVAADGLSSEQRKVVIAGLVQSRAISDVRQRQVDGLLADVGQQVIQLSADNLTTDRVAAYVTDVRSIPSGSGGPPDDLFILGSGRLQVSDESRGLFCGRQSIGDSVAWGKLHGFIRNASGVGAGRGGCGSRAELISGWAGDE